MPLSGDLCQAAGRPIFLFNASEASWVKKAGWPGSGDALRFPTYVTDGPFLYRTGSGTLLMLWSSLGWKGYAMGLARSLSGEVTGPWVHQEGALFEEDGGHGMVFNTMEGQLMMTLHQPNQTPFERAKLFRLADLGDSLKVEDQS